MKEDHDNAPLFHENENNTAFPFVRFSWTGNPYFSNALLSA
jgi:hypothetical protein